MPNMIEKIKAMNDGEESWTAVFCSDREKAICELAYELITLWEAELEWKSCPPDGPCKDRLEAVDRALDALNTKAAEVLKD